MEICNGGRGSLAHEEIVHNESTCPLCKMMDKKTELEAEIDRLNMEE
jgi:hypothetical protein